MKYKKEGVDDSYLALYKFFFIISSPLFCSIHTLFIIRISYCFATIEYCYYRIPCSIPTKPNFIELILLI